MGSGISHLGSALNSVCGRRQEVASAPATQPGRQTGECGHAGPLSGLAGMRWTRGGSLAEEAMPAPRRRAGKPAVSSRRPASTSDALVQMPACVRPDSSLSALPSPLLGKIALALRSPDLFETFNHLHALSMTSPELRAQVLGDERLRYDHLQGLVEVANTLAEVLPFDRCAHDMLFSLDTMLTLLSPRNREHIVKVATRVGDGSIEEAHKARMLVMLVRGAGQLTESQRERVVSAVMAQPCRLASLTFAMEHWSEAQRERIVAAAAGAEERVLVDALEGLGAAMAHLTEAQCDRLLAAATSLCDQASRADALTHLCAGMKHLSQPQRERFIDAMADLPNQAKAKVLAAMGEAMAHLDEAQRARVFDEALFGTSDLQVLLEAEACALIGMVDGMAHLPPAQRERLLDTAIGLDHAKFKARVLARLGAGMESLSEAQRDRLVDAVMGMADQDARAMSLAGLVGNIRHLGISQRERVLAASLAVSPPHVKSQLLGGFADAMAHLGEVQRERLLDAAIGIGPEAERAVALTGLSGGLVHLSDAQRDRLIDAGCALERPRLRAGMMAALGAGAAHLSEAQRDRLLDEAARLAVPRNFSVALKGLAAGAGALNEAQRERMVGLVTGIHIEEDRAGAVAALGAGLAHLSESQCERLLASAIDIRPGRSWRTVGRALKELGVRMEHLSPALRERLVRVVMSVPDEQAKRAGLDGLVAGVAAMVENLHRLWAATSD